MIRETATRQQDRQKGREMVYLDMDQLLVLVLLLLLRGSATSQTTSSSTAGFSTPPHYHTTSSETQPESATSQTTSSSTAGFSTPPHYLTTSSETQPESDSVRLVNGTSLCSGRLEVRSTQSNQRWSSVCEAVFDQQDAEVVCRELGCGAPSVLQGALYGEVEAPMWTKEFQCEGNESALLDCRSSGSDRNTCSTGRALGLTCSEPVRLVGGDSRCAGILELKHQGVWRPVGDALWPMKTAAAACRELNCGSAVSVRDTQASSDTWNINPFCVQSGSALGECVILLSFSSPITNLTCSDSVRLVNGTSLCSGRLEVRSTQSNQRWSSVCEAVFDQQDAEVVCRELGCGAPSVLQGALYGEVEAPMWTKEFQCEGNESALLDCRSSGSDRNSCSTGRAVGLTCSGSQPTSPTPYIIRVVVLPLTLLLVNTAL